MSRPPLDPEKSVAGIIVDPNTLQRVIPESRRSDGTVRKQIKIRPGFTPQEDVRRFRGTKQIQMDVNSLPKGHIIGWAPPLTSTASSSNSTTPMSKSAKKNAKRKEKREKEKEKVPDDWEDDEDNSNPPASSATNADTTSTKEVSTKPASDNTKGAADELTSKLEKLDVK
ncbi:hypothetical protein CPB84DRAFT_1956651 [Gymnopilus junonius]|uniref:WIBG Mago-binding domain-containing protein n=1 Tax=Gymnopilus junonius TaxID=109634 RepID=A0A9P5P2P3_GYMJU|nr:hypothetical protein CPB84DRAFT_1956651 [Gymnopilus junonius]